MERPLLTHVTAEVGLCSSLLQTPSFTNNLLITQSLKIWRQHILSFSAWLLSERRLWRIGWLRVNRRRVHYPPSHASVWFIIHPRVSDITPHSSDTSCPRLWVRGVGEAGLDWPPFFWISRFVSPNPWCHQVPLVPTFQHLPLVRSWFLESWHRSRCQWVRTGCWDILLNELWLWAKATHVG